MFSLNLMHNSYLHRIARRISALCFLFIAFTVVNAQTVQTVFTSTEIKANYKDEYRKTFYTPMTLKGSFDIASKKLTLTSFTMDPLTVDTGDGNVQIKITPKSSPVASGTFDWGTGAVKFTMPVAIQITSTDLNMGSQCKFEASLNLTTGTSGSLSGTPFPANATEGAFKVVDNTFLLTKPSGSTCTMKYDVIINPVLSSMKSGDLGLQIKFNGMLTPPVVVELTEKEPNNTADQATSTTGLPTAIKGSTSLSDPDYFRMVIPSGKSATLEHVVTIKTTQKVNCNPDDETTYQPSTTYSGTMISINGQSDYTSSTVQTGDSCPPVYKEGVTKVVTQTTTTTYTLSYVFPPSGASQTVTFPVQAVSKVAGAPTSGAYSISVK